LIAPTPTDTYTAFLSTKRFEDTPTGIDIPIEAISPVLYDFQRALVRWALRRGRAGLFAHTGLGKGLMLLECVEHIPGPVLILAPLAVTHQLVRESLKHFGRTLEYVRHPDQISQRVVVTNYEMMRNFYGMPFTGLICDESSIIKSITSATREELLTHFTHIPFRICCTATPAPNDIAEIGNHAELLGVMKRTDMLSTFFVHRDTGWSLRGHAAKAFYRWLASWAMALRSPDDLGFDGRAFVLPPLTIKTHFVKGEYYRDGELLPAYGLKGITDRSAVRRGTITEKVSIAAQLARAAAGQVTIWCGLNDESTAIANALDMESTVEITGSDAIATKETKLLRFIDGDARLMVSKPVICGHGLNLQNAHTAIFVGLSDSWESWFQTIRRIWRYGQQEEVTVHVVLSEHEHPILENIQRKEHEAEKMVSAMIEHMQGHEQEAIRQETTHITAMPVHHYSGPGWNLYQGDCVDGLQHIADNSVGLTVSSPPFLSLYQYNATERDLGNSKNITEFFAHLGYVADQLMRITMPGRHVAWHVSQVPAMLVRDGWIGMKDFRGETVRHMTEWGWLYHGEVVISKGPQAQAIRIRAKGLAFHQLKKDSSWLRPALCDYILLFRKPGENPVPIVPDVDNETWIRWANGVWYGLHDDPAWGIRETDTLNAAEAREHDDDKHICPLALPVIERCIRLWSCPDEVVADCFAGIGSTGVVALQHERRFAGCELKASYAETAIKNLSRTLDNQKQQRLF
jgi:DNA methylase/SNF2-related domain